MTLLQKQKIFSRKLAELILKAYEMGFEVSMGECWRPQETAELYARDGRGIDNSLHRIRLAVDLNLFKNGRYLTDSFGYDELAVWWKAQSTEELNFTWGGDFKVNRDFVHYSLENNGVR